MSDEKKIPENDSLPTPDEMPVKDMPVEEPDAAPSQDTPDQGSLASRVDALEQNMAGLVQAIGQQLQQIGAHLQYLGVGSSQLNVKTSVIAFLLVSEDAKDFREKLFAGTLTEEDLGEIEQTYVVPELKRQAEEAQRAAEEEMRRQQSGIVGPDGQPISAETAGNVVGMDGQPIQSAPPVVGMDDDDDEELSD